MKNRELYEAKQHARAEIARISTENNGKITPFLVVESARDPESPIHDYFDWDDASAAEKYRIEQARGLIRQCRVEVTTEMRSYEIPKYVRDPSAAPVEQGYIETCRVKTDEDGARDVLIRYFRAARNQLVTAKRLAAFFDMEKEIDDITETLDGMTMRLTSEVTQHLAALS